MSINTYYVAENLIQFVSSTNLTYIFIIYQTYIKYVYFHTFTHLHLKCNNKLKFLFYLS